MNNELAMRTLAYLITHYKEHYETIINSEEIEAIEFLQQENQDYLEKENEKLHHYKTLYQSLKKQKEELRSWLVEQEEKSWDEVSSTFGYVLEKLEELEGVSNE